MRINSIVYETNPIIEWKWKSIQEYMLHAG